MRAFTILSLITVASAGNGYFYCKPSKCQTDSSTSGSIDSSASDVNVFPADSEFDYVRSDAGSRGFGVSDSSIGQYVKPVGPRSGNNFDFNTGGRTISPVRLSDDQTINESINKESYSFSVPADDNADVEADSIQMKLRVVFIKAPDNNNAAHREAFQLAKQAIQDRTHIYVLSRQPEVSELVTEVRMLSESFRQKPQVKFIKYRTPQDAVTAQHLIQQQYEAMGGSSRSINGAVAPVLNYASVQSGIVNNVFARQGPAFTRPSVIQYSNQPQGFSDYFSQNRRNEIQFRKPQAVHATQFNQQVHAPQFNQQQFSYNDLRGPSNIVNKGALPAVSFSSTKALPPKTADQSNKEREETETFIYVLSKEPNIQEVVDKFRELTEAAKLRPEVRFVKYKTPQEAIDAQQYIQQQYDALGGSSTSDV